MTGILTWKSNVSDLSRSRRTHTTVTNEMIDVDWRWSTYDISTDRVFLGDKFDKICAEKRMFAIIFMKSTTCSSQLHWNLMPQSVHDYMSWTVCREFVTKTRFCSLMTMHELIGLRTTTEYLSGNRIESYRFESVQLLSFSQTEKEFNLTILNHGIECLTNEDFQNCFDDWFSRMLKCWRVLCKT